MAGGPLRAHYQPIVELSSGAVVAYEALARDSDGRFPAAAFAAARADGTLAELDRRCQRAAFDGAAGLRPPAALFVNVEPDCFDGSVEAELDVRVVVEITERSLATRPAELLLAVERIRERGWGSPSTTSAPTGARWR